MGSTFETSTQGMLGVTLSYHRQLSHRSFVLGSDFSFTISIRLSLASVDKLR